ncbi:MAG: IPT/TIG domain-containing protein [Acidobacteria bacterium]|nr:IPT/TIG domain-containing protein [Acidobacteriota bacterium]
MFKRFGILLTTVLIFLSGASAVRAASVTLSATPASATVNQGQAAVYTINLSRDGFPDKVTLSASALPAGATAAFNASPTTAKSAALTVTTAATTPAGTYQIKIAGSAVGVNIASITVTLVVKPAPRVALSALPATQSVVAGQSVTYQISVARTNYDGPVTLEAVDLPAGLSASFEPNPVVGSTTMRVYAHPTMFFPKDYQLAVRVRESIPFDLQPVNLRVNCGVVWAEQFGTAAGGDFARDVAVAADGSIYVAGDSFNPNNNSMDVWVAKYNANGLQQWFAPFGTTAEDHATEIAVDAAGGVFVGGYTAGAFAGSNLGNFDFWVAKYNSAGVRQWINQGGTRDQDGFAGLEIVPDNAGGGRLVTSTDERTRISTYAFTSAGALTRQNSFPLVLDFNVLDSDIADLAVDANGGVYVVGHIVEPAFGTWEGWIVKYDNSQSSFNRIWSQIDGQGPATRVVVDASGNAYVSGLMATAQDAWIARFSSYAPASGTNPVSTNPPVWTVTEGSPQEDVVNGMAVNGSGDLIVAGMTQGVLGERNGGGNGAGTRFDDAWVEHRDPATGGLRWIRQFAVADIDGFNAVAVGPNDDTILAGYTVAFRTNVGYEDALLMRYTDGWTLLSPSIDATTPFSPARARVGQTVRINGRNLLGASAVRFGDIPARFTAVSSTAIDAVVPAGAVSGRITVSLNCDSVSTPTNFTVVP